MKKTLDKEYLEKVIKKGSVAVLQHDVRRLSGGDKSVPAHDRNKAIAYIQYLAVRAMENPNEINPEELRETYRDLKEDAVGSIRRALHNVGAVLQSWLLYKENSEHPEDLDGFEEFFDRVPAERLDEIQEKVQKRWDKLMKERAKEEANEMFA